MTFAGPWWRDRTPRERVLLALLGVLLLGVGLWLGVQRPLAAGRAAAASRHQSAATALADVQRMGVAIRAAEAKASTARSVPIVERVGARATAAGMTIASLDPDGDSGARLVIAAVRPQPLLTWLAALERDDGLVIQSLNITRNDDATVAVQMTVRTPT